MTKKTLHHDSQLLDRIQDLENQWKRAVADYHNLEKRVHDQQVDFVKFANAALIDKLLAVLDDLERAAEHLQDSGLNLVVNHFTAVLTTEGVAEIKALHTPFDPTTMDAAEMVKGPANQVVAVVAKGYTLNGKVIRPAKVKVGHNEAASVDHKH